MKSNYPWEGPTGFDLRRFFPSIVVDAVITTFFATLIVLATVYGMIFLCGRVNEWQLQQALQENAAKQPAGLHYSMPERHRPAAGMAPGGDIPIA